MPTRLIALSQGPDISVGRFPVLAGRDRQCDARIRSSRVSRRHCCLAEEDGEVVVQDLGSTNGVWINGRRVVSGRLRPGDELSIAHLRFRVEDPQDLEATRPHRRGPEVRDAAAREIGDLRKIGARACSRETQ